MSNFKIKIIFACLLIFTSWVGVATAETGTCRRTDSTAEITYPRRLTEAECNSLGSRAAYWVPAGQNTTTPPVTGPQAPTLTPTDTTPIVLSSIPPFATQYSSIQITANVFVRDLPINTPVVVSFSSSAGSFSSTSCTVIKSSTPVATNSCIVTYTAPGQIGSVSNIRASVNINGPSYNDSLPIIVLSSQAAGALSTATTAATPPEAGTTSYKLLAPFPGVIEDSFDAAGTNAFGKYLNLMIKIFIGLAGVFAVVAMVMGGIEYMTSELLHTKEHGKSMMTNALLGLLIALGAYTILNTINPTLLKTDVTTGLGDGTTIVYQSLDIPQACPTGGQCGGFHTGTNWASVATQPPTALLGQMSVNHIGDCNVVGQRDCTSLRGLDISIARTTQEGCKCSINITGGTETWLHSINSSHRPGSATVDLSVTPELTRYIMGNSTTQPQMLHRYPRNGVSYLFEGNHWHADYFRN